MAGYVIRYKDYSIEGFMAWAITNPNIKTCRIKENKSKLNKALATNERYTTQQKNFAAKSSLDF